MLLLAAPAGMAGDRVGARRLTLAGGVLVTVSALGQALADSYPALLGWRIVFGAAFAVVWTAAPAWLAQTAPGGGEARVGATMTYAAVGVVLAPALSGLLAERAGLGAPFWAAGVAALLVTALMSALPRGAARTPAAAPRRSLGGTVRAAWGQPAVFAGAGAIALSGALTGVVQLLAPLALHAEQVSTAAIGLAFAAAAGVSIATSAGVLWAGARAVTLPVLMLAALGCAVALAPAALSASSAAVVIAMLLFSAPRATLSTTVYPLATREGARAGLGESGVLGTLNSVWAAASVAGPLGAGALSAALGTRSGFLVTVAAATLAVAWLARPSSPPGPVAAR